MLFGFKTSVCTGSGVGRDKLTPSVSVQTNKRLIFNTTNGILLPYPSRHSKGTYQVSEVEDVAGTLNMVVATTCSMCTNHCFRDLLSIHVGSALALAYAAQVRSRG